ncbi:CaiB/BaiF CoA transferase family protein [Pseudorhodoferax sp.]|uniref:CaiB/BaiF CoA transferase family protein n=1 Tax=Pseudorhodoferax sp. TaxID=1993553 RepID=UPI002DD67848|nr:CoA transferase [Pseudorhodoferax sp.]
MANPDKPAPGSAGPLAGLRVLDLGTMVAGPVACTLLADFGAEVIKVEQPGSGDTMRGLGPHIGGESLYWNVDNRNKKSVTIDLRRPAGQALVKRLVERSDALVENFRPGTMERWKLGYATLAELRPALVMLSVSGFGQTGPYAQRAAYDRMALAFSGVMGLTGFADRAPVRTGISVADYTTACMGAFALMMALYHRDAKGGRGEHIDLALYESMFRFTEVLTAAYDKLGIVRERRGNVHFAAAPGEHFRTSDDRYLILTISGDTLFERLCAAMGRPELARDPRYATHEQRWQQIQVLNDIVATWIRATPVEQVTGALEAHGIPFSLVLSIADIVRDPQYAARENIVTVDHERLGPLKMQGVVPKLAGHAPRTIAAAPTLGQHTEEVLRGLLGLTQDEYAALRADGVV